MKNDFEFVVQLADHDGNKITRVVIVDAVIFLRGRIRYRFSLGATSGSGRIEITFSRLENIRRENQKYDLMDYNTSLDDCDDVIEIVVPSALELEQRREAARRWFNEDAARSSSLEADNDAVSCQALQVDVGADLNREVLLRCGINK